MPVVETWDKKQDFEFEQREFNEAWSIFEHYASGNFNEVADYEYRSLRSFYNSGLEFIRAKVKYRKALEKRFNVKLE